jgi:hypothetical protein
VTAAFADVVLYAKITGETRININKKVLNNKIKGKNYFYRMLLKEIRYVS